LSRRYQLEVVPSRVGGLTYAGTAVVEEQDERVVAPSVGGSPVRFGNDGAHINGFEIRCRSLPSLLRRDRQNSRVLLRVDQIIADQMLEKAADGGAPAVAGGGRVLALGLDVIEEARDRGTRPVAAALWIT
jgi:hypothetical protein